MEKYLAILKEYWGYTAFRTLQPEIIQSVGSGNDTLGLMPTGGGKSLTFQVPALTMEGTCIVITPLIALMKDQVANLRKRGISAAAIFTGQTRTEMNVIFDNAIYGHCKFLYVSPERLQSELFLKKIPNMQVCMVVVDEAHCISQWGYDFRPSYLSIPEVFDYIDGRPPILALTATATPQVADDIMQKLQFRSPNMFRKSFERPNISYIVRYADDKDHQLFHILNHTKGSAIVYVRSRQKTYDYAKLLNSNDIPALYYHAGLSAKQKDEYQTRWTRGDVRVMVCTNAFGMGIDKPDVRVVIHMDVPDSLEAYFQEAGRAGRDEQRSYAVLLWNKKDIAKLERRVPDTFPEKDFILQVYNNLAYYFGIAVGEGEDLLCEFDIMDFCRQYHMSATWVNSALKILHNQGIIAYQEDADFDSRVQILASRAEVDRVRMEHPDLNGCLVTLMRNYEGLFTQYCTIDEQLIANKTGLSAQDVYERLKMLGKMHIISYNPRKHCTTVQYLVRRIDEGLLRITEDVYDMRKADLEQRLKSVIAYCQKMSQCRSVLLLRYFGEIADHACGCCDVCQTRIAKQKADESLPQIILEIVRQAGGIDLNSLMELLRNQAPQLSDNDLYQHVNLMLMEHRLTILNGQTIKLGNNL